MRWKTNARLDLQAGTNKGAEMAPGMGTKLMFNSQIKHLDVNLFWGASHRTQKIDHVA
ncbi:MAG TPA: hypothetical protein VE862_03045 [Candidatus Acidoferrum sp.]|nr:hypothetical protein [Candidatus Acidoferrum sp.]